MPPRSTSDSDPEPLGPNPPEGMQGVFPPRDLVGFKLAFTARVARELFEERLDRLLPGLRLRHFRLLMALFHGGPRTQQELGRLLHVDRTSMVGAVDLLEQHGIARRERHPHDRRAYVVTLTRKGRTMVTRAKKLAAEAEDELLEPLGGPDRDRLRELLGRLLDAHAGPGGPPMGPPSGSRR